MHYLFYMKANNYTPFSSLHNFLFKHTISSRQAPNDLQSEIIVTRLPLPITENPDRFYSVGAFS